MSNIKIKREKAYHTEEQFDPQIDIIQQYQQSSISILTQNSEKIVFLIKGIDAPIANALRRIMIAEVPTMAIHIITMYQNTSVIPDEVLAHRLGLIPISANAQDFVFKKEDDELNEQNSIKMTLHVKCTKKKEFENQNYDPLDHEQIDKYLDNTTVFSSDLKWVPIGNQQQKMKVKPVHNEIIIAKLRENQEIWCDIACVKGFGKQHAKWSPVCTAFYKLMPKIDIKQPIRGQEAIELKKLCPMKVFDIENDTAYVSKGMKCTMCRECIREEHSFKNKIELEKVKQEFIFTVESVGMYKPEEIVKESLKILKEKSLSYQIE